MGPIRTKLLVAFLILTAISLFQTIASLRNFKIKNQITSLSQDLDHVSKKVLELYKFEKDLLANEIFQAEFKADSSPAIGHIHATLANIEADMKRIDDPSRTAYLAVPPKTFAKSLVTFSKYQTAYEQKLSALLQHIAENKRAVPQTLSAPMVSPALQSALDEQIANLYQSVEQLQNTVQAQVLANNSNYAKIFIGLGFLLLFSSIILSFTFSNKIASPIIDLSNEVEKFSKNGFTSGLTTPAPKSSDELKQLKHNIYSMGEKFQETLEELRQSNDRLKASNAHLQRFAHIVSHDLRAPLRTIHSFLGLLKRSISDKMQEKEKDYLRFVQEGTMKMNQLITDILEFSKVDTQSIHLKERDLQNILQEVLDFNDYQITERKAIINIDNKLTDILCDPIKIKQIFQNLITNAIKYTPLDKQPTVDISCVEMEDHWKFEVRDRGIGIPEKEHERIFLPFSQLKMMHGAEGIGIGLSICKTYIELHGGKIWVESHPVGSSLHFTLSKKPVIPAKEKEIKVTVKGNTFPVN